MLSAFQGYGFSASDGTNTDDASIVLEYRDGLGVVLESYDSGGIAPPNEWHQVEDIRTLPVGTRVVRVRLRSTRDIGLSTDGHHDALSLDIATSGVAPDAD